MRHALPSLSLLILVALACTACGQQADAPPASSATAPPAPTPPGPDEVAAEPEPPPPAERPRSEPPPRPPAPAGVQILRRDAVALALSGDGRFLAGGDLGGHALLWDLTRGRFLWADRTPEGNRLVKVAFAARAPLYLAGATHAPDRPWRLWSADPAERRGELGDEGLVAIDGALDDAGRRALTLSSTLDGGAQRLELWDLATRDLLARVPLTRATRGLVALDAAGERFAVADDLGTVRVWARGPDPSTPPAELFVSDVSAGDPELERPSRLALSGDGASLHGASGARVTRWSVPVDGAAPAPTTTRTIGEEGATDPDPIRGLHRVRGEHGSVIVAVTRPIADGLVIWSTGDGAVIGRLETGCRCESHALSDDGRVAVCGCADAAELRWGRVRASPSEP